MMDNCDGFVTRNPNGRFQRLIDGETAAAAFNCVIQVDQGGVSA